MDFMNEIYHFKKRIRHIEKATKKCVRLNGAIECNKTCITNGVFPKYSHICIYIYLENVFIIYSRYFPMYIVYIYRKQSQRSF